MTTEVCLDQPESNDNRNYDYSTLAWNDREEYAKILRWIPEGANVIDFGCGNGSLLHLMREQKKTNGYGIEISPSGVKSCQDKHLSATCGPIDVQHPQFQDKQFDVAICNVTLQMVMYPEVLLREMARVASSVIISFPNFGYFRNRLDLLIHGRMPRPTLFRYTWYSTGHIHQLSIVDFEELVSQISGLRIVDMQCAEEVHGVRKFLRQQFPNAFCLTPIFRLESSRGSHS